MNVSVIGLGYVGLATALALASKGHHAYGYDIAQDKITALKRGQAPFHEPLIEEYLQKTLDKTFFVESSLEKALVSADVIIVCVNTPSLPDGRMNDAQLKRAITDVSTVLQALDDGKYRLIIIKSTVVPGTTRTLRHMIETQFGLIRDRDFGMAMMPEFLRQGQALHDSLQPSRLIGGVFSEKEKTILFELFKAFDAPMLFTSPETAEFVKYATNSFLALKISFANELANIMTHFVLNYENEDISVDVDQVISLLGLDPRINPAHMKPGMGFGGSCFPKDVKALTALARQHDYIPLLLPQILRLNERQPQVFIKLLKRKLDSLSGKTVAILGLAFKAGTDDVREAPSLPLVSTLLAEGARVIVHDPKAVPNFMRAFPDHESVIIADTVADAVKNVDAAILVTEWPSTVEYLNSLERRDFLLVDGRGVLKNADIALGKTQLNMKQRPKNEEQKETRGAH